ncbi:MAG: hypothetical protein RJA22_2937 [Verrucomicrobiota bacterium]|jgi:sigma-B regulation protein RsbU (phosphoserine phosphatase)
MHAPHSIVLRLVLIIACSSALIFGVTLGYNYHRSRAILRHELESNARNLALALVGRVETQLVAVTKISQGLGRSLEATPHDEAELLALLRATLEGNPSLEGVGAGFEPGAAPGGTRLCAPFYFRDQGGPVLRRLDTASPELPYLYQDWYQIPRELGVTEWSEPYHDAASSNLLASCSVPFHTGTGPDRRLAGIVSCSVSLSSLTELVSSVQVLRTGYAALLSRNGMILAHPLPDAIINETFFSIAEQRQDAWMRDLGRKMVRGETGFVSYQSLVGFRSWMYYTPIQSTGWTLAVVFPEDELLENVRQLTWTMAGMGLAGLLLLSLAIVSIAQAITRPLRRLAHASHEVASGNFDAPLPPVRSRDEVGTLTRDFQSMQASLKDYIRNLTETTAAKERIQGELKVATQIQASLLPRIFPPFPDHPEFDIYASMVPAKEVGGDFYDFFFLDERNLCFLIADVSDKGVPAALYMMVAKTLLKTEGQRLREPALILSSVNRILATDNEGCMFTTVFCAVLDIATGEVRYANAGHNPPLLLDARGARYLEIKPSLMLGATPGVEYATHRLSLQPGDTLFLYTDGVTEAKNRADQLFGEDRLRETLGRAPRGDLRSLIVHLGSEITRHADGAPPSDDVTMLAIRLAPQPPTSGG